MTVDLGKLPVDVQLRKRLFDPRSFQHDARANLALLDRLVRDYTRLGDLILDPMAGTGSLYLAGTAGRRVICGELENWLTRERGQDGVPPILESNRRRSAAWTRAPSLACQWNALALPLDLGTVDAVIFSPPYGDMFSDWHISSNRLKKRHIGPHGSAYGDDRGRKVKRNVGNLHIYEDYLAAMRQVFAECYRVLKAGRPMCVIVKDKIKGGQRVPIVDDLTTVLQAGGFLLEQGAVHSPRLSQYRQLHKAKGLPVIEDEKVIVVTKPLGRPHDWPPQALRWHLVMVPEAEGPPSLVYAKALAMARNDPGAQVFSFLPGAWPDSPFVSPDLAPRLAPDPFAEVKFRMRVQVGFRAVEHLVGLGLRAGDHVVLHVAWRYGAYLAKRLGTLGCTVEAPTRGLNMGQKMTYYTHRAKVHPAD